MRGRADRKGRRDESSAISNALDSRTWLNVFWSKRSGFNRARSSIIFVIPGCTAPRWRQRCRHVHPPFYHKSQPAFGWTGHRFIGWQPLVSWPWIYVDSPASRDLCYMRHCAEILAGCTWRTKGCTIRSAPLVIRPTKLPMLTLGWAYSEVLQRSLSSQFPLTGQNHDRTIRRSVEATRLSAILYPICWCVCLVQPVQYPTSICLTTLNYLSATVRHSEFKTCSQSGFCKRNRDFARVAAASETWTSPYTLDSKSLDFDNGILTGVLTKELEEQEVIRLPITIAFLEVGAIRVSIDEERRQKESILLRQGSRAQKRRYDESEKWAVSGNLTACRQSVLVDDETPWHSLTRIRHGNNGQLQTTIHHSPFSIDIERNGQVEVQFNSRGFLNIEHWREQDTNADALGSRRSEEDSWWEESFGGSTDSKPRGPESVALDVSFIGYRHVYGIPEHATSLSLKETTGAAPGAYSEPYRLYNTDVFEYELRSPMTLYGSIPFMQAHRANSTAGILWLNGAETWIDLERSGTGSQTHWISEAGVLDVFIFLGDTPRETLASYTAVTGTTQMPQEFALGYHQCRWNYVSDEDVQSVADKLDRHGFPFDAIWLDIEWSDERKYFEWNPLSFRDSEGMHAHLDRLGRNQILVLDSHVKIDDGYDIMHQVKQHDLAVKTKDNEQLFAGKCWPGDSYWVDHFNPKAVIWWKALFRYNAFQGTFSNTFFWNDMGEPSVMDGPEATMPRDNIHYGGWEHRDLHNINGLAFHEATYNALLARSDDEIFTPRRPFVLTRSFFAGSQRTSMAWTGDNCCSWGHLAASIPMLLNNGISGFPAIGADVPGYFGDASPEMIARWYQAGAFYPFFRAHGHMDTKRREPYLFPEPYRSIMIRAVRLRYQLMPGSPSPYRTCSGQIR